MDSLVGAGPASQGILGAFRRDPSKILVGVWYASLLAAGTWLILRSSPWGIGVRVDSLSYLTAAQSLAAGKCLCWLGSGLELKPLVHFGPVYPSVVAAGSLLGLSILESARLLGAVLYGANLAISAGAVHVVTKNPWAGIAAAFVFGASPVIVEAHDSAMSEPLFLFLLMAGFLALAVYLDGRRTPFLGLAALACGLAVLTRYAGSSMLLAGAGALLLVNRGSWRIRIRDAMVFALASVLPLSLWLLRNVSVSGTMTNRVLGYHPVTADDARALLDIVTGWLTSARTSHWIEGFLLAALLVAAAWIVWRYTRSDSGVERRAGGLGVILMVYILVYAPMLALSRTYFDAKIPIDDRMLSPWYTSLALMASIVAGVSLRGLRRTWWIVGIVLLFLAGPGRYMVDGSRRVLGRLEGEGVGFAGRAWRESASLDWVRGLSRDALLYSNKALAIQLLLGRGAYQPPERYDEVKAQFREDFLENLDRMYADLERPNSYLLIFDPVRPIESGDVEDEFTVGLVLIETLRDGVVYADPSSIAGP